MRSSAKSTLWLIVGVTGFIGGYVPVLLWKADGFGLESIVGGMIGGLIGIWLWYRFLR